MVTPHLIALDIDGTVLGYDGSLSARVSRAIREARSAGHHVVIATGRSISGVWPVLALLEQTRGPVVCSNGAVTIDIDPSAPDGYHLANIVTFEPRKVVELVQRALPDALLAVERPGGAIVVNQPWPEVEFVEQFEIAPLETLLDEPTTRVVVRSPQHTAEEFSEIVSTLGLHGMNYSIGYTAWLDLAPEGVSKAYALEGLRAKLDVPHERTIAVGDGRNDIEMLQWAHRGVAMENAHDALKEVADEIGPDVREDGVAVLLEGLTFPTGH